MTIASCQMLEASRNRSNRVLRPTWIYMCNGHDFRCACRSKGGSRGCRTPSKDFTKLTDRKNVT